MTVGVVVPAFNEQLLILDTLAGIPDFVDAIVVIDDASTDDTGAKVLECTDPRVTLITHEKNSGVGGSILDGHRRMLSDGIEISVVMAGDNQMPPEFLSSLITPIVDGTADFAKGNRFYSEDSVRGMPKLRLYGSVALSLMTKAASGYWDLFDPQNGYTAIHRRALERMSLDEISQGYSFENSMLIHLNVVGARVVDVSIPARYGTETSTMNLATAGPSIACELFRGFWMRMHRKHVVPRPTAAGLFLALALVVGLFGLVVGAFATYYSRGTASASAGTVLLAVGSVIVALQFAIAALWIDYSMSRSGSLR